MATPTLGLTPTRTNNVIDRAFAAIHERLDALEQGGGGGSVSIETETFTPQVYGSNGPTYAMSASDNFGQSTRLGDLVIVQGKFTVEGIGTATGIFRLGGFPVAPYFDDGLNDLSPDDESGLHGLFAWVAPENGFEFTLNTNNYQASAVPFVSVAFNALTVSATPGEGFTDLGGGTYAGAGIGMQAEANSGDSGGTVSANNCGDLGFFGQTFRFCAIYRGAPVSP